jgi:hypothetical protein
VILPACRDAQWATKAEILKVLHSKPQIRCLQKTPGDRWHRPSRNRVLRRKAGRGRKVPAAWITAEQVPAIWKPLLLPSRPDTPPKGKIPLSSLSESGFEEAQDLIGARKYDIDPMNWPPHSPLRTHLSLPPPYRRLTTNSSDPEPSPQRLPAHERQRWREAPQREAGIGVSPLELVGGRAVGGDEESEALVEDLAHRLLAAWRSGAGDFFTRSGWVQGCCTRIFAAPSGLAPVR